MLRWASLLVLAATACGEGPRDEDAGRLHELPRVHRDAGDGGDDGGMTPAGGVPGVEGAE